MKIYIFTGKIGTGKDYLCEALKKMLPQDARLLHIALADHFKIDAITKDKVPYEKVYGNKDAKSRDMLQKRGTEEGRMKYGDDIWINTVDVWLKIHEERGVEYAFITDARFPNEVDHFQNKYKSKCIVIRINAPERNLKKLEQEGDKNLKTHVSETALDDYEFDLIINNDPKDSATALSEIRRLALNDNIHYNDVAFVDLDDTISHCGKYYSATASKMGELVAEFLIDNSNVNYSRGTKEHQEFYKTTLAEHTRRLYLCTFNRFYDSVTTNYEASCFTRNNFAEFLETTTIKTLDFYGFKDTSGLSDKALKMGMGIYLSEFDPIPGAIDALKKLKTLVDKVVIFTVGERPDQIWKLYKLGLEDFTCETFIHKDETLFNVLKHKYQAKHYIMIGDSLTRDIKPAINAGIDDIYHVSPELVNIDKNVNIVKSLEIAVENFKNKRESVLPNKNF